MDEDIYYLESYRSNKPRSRKGDAQTPAVWKINIKTLTGKKFDVEVKNFALAFCEVCMGPSTMQYPDLVERLQKKHKWDIVFTISLVKEFARFLELKCCMKDWGCKKIFPSPLIDQVWEECLEDIASYEKMCKEIHGKCKALGPHHSIHRIPKNMGHLSSTLVAYEARFSDPPDENYWSEDAEAVLVGPPTCGCLAASVSISEGIPVDQMQLSYENRLLEPGVPLKAYGIGHESTVHLVLRLSGC